MSTLLVKRGANLNAEDHRHGRTALHLSAELGFAEFVDMLIVRGANMYASGGRADGQISSAVRS